MADPYRWGAPPPAAVAYRRERARQRDERARVNWWLEQGVSKAEAAYSAFIPSSPPGLPGPRPAAHPPLPVP